MYTFPALIHDISYFYINRVRSVEFPTLASARASGRSLVRPTIFCINFLFNKSDILALLKSNK